MADVGALVPHTKQRRHSGSNAYFKCPLTLGGHSWWDPLDPLLTACDRYQPVFEPVRPYFGNRGPLAQGSNTYICSVGLDRPPSQLVPSGGRACAYRSRAWKNGPTSIFIFKFGLSLVRGCYHTLEFSGLCYPTVTLSSPANGGSVYKHKHPLLMSSWVNLGVYTLSSFA